METAILASACFDPHYDAGVLVVSLNTLTKPDSGDTDPDNPEACPDGLAIYARFCASRTVISGICKTPPILQTLAHKRLDWDDADAYIVVYTYGPLVAAARWHAQNAPTAQYAGNPGPTDNAIDALVQSLPPYCVFQEDMCDERWTELLYRH